MIKQFTTKVDVLKQFMSERNLLISSGIEPVVNDVGVEVKAKVRERDLTILPGRDSTSTSARGTSKCLQHV